MEELLRLEGVLGGQLKFRPGDMVRYRRASHFSAGFVHVVGQSVEEVEARMREVLAVFQMQVATAVPPAANFEESNARFHSSAL